MLQFSLPTFLFGIINIAIGLSLFILVFMIGIRALKALDIYIKKNKIL